MVPYRVDVLMVGLTGGIGAGKSAAATRFAELGAVVIDSDQAARDVVAPGTDGLGEIVAAFGPGVLTADGSLDRPALGRLVFGDAPARRRLEQITHPRVRTRVAELTAAAPADAVVVNDIPLLVEAGHGSAYHLVVVVQADDALRMARLTRGRGLSEADARARMAAQATDAQRAAVADVLLVNDGALADLRDAISTLWTDRLVPFERNVREQVAVWPSHARVEPYDPTWPQRYERIAARIARAAGPLAPRIDHIGSTAVPDLPAKSTVDIQATVADLEAADALAAPLAAVGLPRAPGEWFDNPRAAPGSPPWPKRLHGSADPGQPVNLHVRVAGSPGWRYALLMRDYLRAVEPERAEYAELKQRLAGGGLTRARYAAAKDPWFDAVLPRMEAWAARTGWTPAPP